MTAELKSTWHTINKVLTIINLIFFGILTGNVFRFKELENKKVPVIANVVLLFVLGVCVFAAIYKLRIS